MMNSRNLWKTLVASLVFWTGGNLCAQDPAPPEPKAADERPAAPKAPLAPVVLPKNLAKISGENVTSDQLVIYAARQQVCADYLDWLIYERLVNQQLKKRKLSVELHEVEKELKAVREQVAATTKGTLEDQLRDTRMTVEDLKRVLATDIGVSKLVKLEYGVKFDPKVETDRVEQWMVNLKRHASVLYQDSGEKIPANAVVTVNDEPITIEEFQKVICAKLEDRQLSDLLQEMINKRVVRQYAAENKIAVDAKDIDYYVSLYEQGMWMREPRLRSVPLGQFLEHNFKETIEQFKKREHIQMDALIYKILSPKLTDAQVRQHYEKHPEIYSDEEVRASLILIGAAAKGGAQATKDELESAMKKARDIRKKLDDGADFADLARKMSDDKESALNGGDLGFFRRSGRVPRDVAEQAFLLNVGEISQPVPFYSTPPSDPAERTRQADNPEKARDLWGYFIVKKVEQKKASELTPILIDAIRSDMIRFNLFADFIRGLKEKAKIEVYFGPADGGPVAPRQ